MKIKIAGLDPSLRHFGLAKGVYDISTGEYIITDIFTQDTESEAGKTVRKSSDDLRCANLIVDKLHKWIDGCGAVFAEIPSGSQSARGSFSNGICLGTLGSVGAVGNFKGKLIQVSPTEVKKAAIGSKVASKEEMVEWASEKFPHLPWVKGRTAATKGIVSVPKNEHMADAIAAINAGVNTAEFKILTQMLLTLSSS